MFEDVDFKDCKVLFIEKESGNLKEDLLRLCCPNGRLICVGWYGDKAKFCLTVIENNNWDKPIYKLSGYAKEKYIVRYLQEAIDYETAHFPHEVEILYKSLKDHFAQWEGSEANDRSEITTPNDLVKFLELPPHAILKQLKNLGREKVEAVSHLNTFALQYRESEKLRWDYICDLLDVIEYQYDKL